jgi:predicted transposase YbfD/YdcC
LENSYRYDLEELEAAFRQFASELQPKIEGKTHICFDGKALCGSGSEARNEKNERIFNVFSNIKEMVIAHISMDSPKDTEVGALEKFLQTLNLKDTVITADAAHCQKKFKLATVAEAIFITQVKNNQKGLLNQIKHGCKVRRSVVFFCDNVDKIHGRVEERSYEVFEASSILDKWKNEWPHILMIAKVTRLRQRINIDKEPAITESYYVIPNPIIK